MKILLRVLGPQGEVGVPGVTPEVLKRGKPPKAQTGRQQGDPELTEPDSDDDSLFGDDPPECAQMEAHGILAPACAISLRQLASAKIMQLLTSIVSSMGGNSP